MNNSQKYKLGTIEIFSFIIGVFILMGLNKYVFFSSELLKATTQIAVVAFFSTLFGSITGGLTGFLGIICSFAICGENVGFPPAIGYAVYGALLGQFANRYLIREGRFRLKQLFLWNCVNVFSLISAFVLVKPMVEFLFYNTDLVTNLKFCAVVVATSAVLVGIVLSVVFFAIGFIEAKIKKVSLG